jgi:hypothetical protein
MMENAHLKSILSLLLLVLDPVQESFWSIRGYPNLTITQIPKENNAFLYMLELDVNKNKNIFMNPLIFLIFLLGSPKEPKIILDLKELWRLKIIILVTLVTWMIVGINEDVTHVTNLPPRE